MSVPYCFPLLAFIEGAARGPWRLSLLACRLLVKGRTAGGVAVKRILVLVLVLRLLLVQLRYVDGVAQNACGSPQGKGPCASQFERDARFTSDASEPAAELRGLGRRRRDELNLGG